MLLPWKNLPKTLKVIRISLRTRATVAHDKYCHMYGQKVQDVLEAWDMRRESWNVLYHVSTEDVDPTTELHIVQPVVRQMKTIHLPVPMISPRPTSLDLVEEWEEEVSSLFEWVGMACLGSQRYTSPPPTHWATDLI